jgi:S-adenosylmethionine/arginine decarboxylase-like enzyme
MIKQKPFGYSFMLDLYDCKEGVADNITLCYDFLEQLVVFLKMQKQSPPYIFRTDAKKYADKAGLSGWVPLVESGIQIHTLTLKNFISIDIYSCGKFEPELVEEFTKRFFEPKKVEKRFTHRGIDYHK